MDAFEAWAGDLRDLARRRRTERAPLNERRLALIEEMEKNNGQLSDEKLAELRELQQKFGLPTDF